MTTVYIPKRRPFPLPEYKWCKNGDVPSAYFQAELNDRINRIAKWRTKEHASFCVNLQASPVVTESATGSRVRWRSASHTGPLCSVIRAKLIVAPAAEVNSNHPSVKLTVTDGGGFTESVSATNLVRPDASGAAGNLPSNWGKANLRLEVPADTAVFLTLSDEDGGRIISGTIFEESLEADTSNGYPPYSYTVGAPILNGDRGTAMVGATAVWKQGASQCFNWCVDYAADARTRTSATDANLFDTSITTVSAATPGFTLDLRYKETSASGGVPVAFKAYGSMASGTGHVYLKNAAGSVVATININSATPGWFGTTAVLPATEAKYDVHFDGDGTNLTTVHAVSCYEYLS